MMKDNQVWEGYFSTLFGTLANIFAGILDGGRYLKSRFAVAEFSLTPTGCYIGSCKIAFKLSRSFITAGDRAAGKIA